MLLRCSRCGNTREFIAAMHGYLYVDVVDDEVEVAHHKVDAGTRAAAPDLICDQCGSSRVETGEKAWDEFFAGYARFAAGG